MHKLSTDDYRYANKIIQSLNSTKEFLISTYGTYDNLSSTLNDNRNKYSLITNDMNNLKSKIDKLSGVIDSLKSQNIENDAYEVDRQINLYNSIVNSFGEYNGLTYDKMVNDQILLNSEISEIKSKRLLKLKDIDVLYSKKENIQNQITNQKRNNEDYNNMKTLINNLELKINNINIKELRNDLDELTDKVHKGPDFTLIKNGTNLVKSRANAHIRIIKKSIGSYDSKK